MGYKKVRLKYMGYRKEIARFLNEEFEKLRGEIECDESYFGGRRKGNRGRGSTGKTKVFGMLERRGKIFTTVVDDVSEVIVGAVVSIIISLPDAMFVNGKVVSKSLIATSRAVVFTVMLEAVKSLLVSPARIV